MGESIQRALERSNQIWEEEHIPNLAEYVPMNPLSLDFDPDWEKHGNIDKAANFYKHIAESYAEHIPGLKVELHRDEGKTPLLFIEVPATNPEKLPAGEVEQPVLMYAHLDTQPPGGTWREGLDPLKVVREGDHLYGRGVSDDGYGMLAALTALRLNAEQGIANPRTVIIVEASEESGSPHLDYYFKKLASQMGKPETVFILDSGTRNYDQFWVTQSLRGIVRLDVKVQTLSEDSNVHSGTGGGIIPNAERIMRQLLTRVEDVHTGNILIEEFHGEITEKDRQEAEALAKEIGDEIFEEFPFAPGVKPASDSNAELLIRSGQEPTMSVLATEGIPTLGRDHAGNAILPWVKYRLSVRVAPDASAERALEALQRTLQKNVPYDAMIEFSNPVAADGWVAPEMPEWLKQAADEASMGAFGKKSASLREGGTIPLAGDVQRSVPDANFMVTGTLGPKNNAHGPNEMLHIPHVKKLTAALSVLLSAHAEHKQSQLS